MICTLKNLILAAHIELLNDNKMAQDTVLAYEQALTAEVKEQCAKELADLYKSMSEGIFIYNIIKTLM